MNSSNIVFLGNGTDWCKKSLEGFKDNKDVSVINDQIILDGIFLKSMVKIHYSYRLNKSFNLPLKNIWYQKFLDFICLKQQLSGDSVLVFYDRNRFAYDEKFLQFLRKKYPGITLVYLFTNIVKFTGATERGKLDKLNEWYDIVYAFDPEDAKKYDFSYSPLIYDAEPTYNKHSVESKENLVFYVGQAKDRLSGLLACFEKLQSIGIKTDFHIANVSTGDMKYKNEIAYNQFMPYNECVKAIQHATCLVDVIQGDSAGLTIKTCEAVCYDKKLITTNKHVVDYPFYDPRYIRVVESPDDIDEEFFVNNRDVHYSKEGKNVFSSASFLKRLEADKANNVKLIRQ